MGLMQLMPATAEELGVSDPYNPSENIRGGVAYLKGLLVKFQQNVELALAAYNAGPTAVTRYGTVPPYRETRDYVTRIKTAVDAVPKGKSIYKTIEIVNGRSSRHHRRNAGPSWSRRRRQPRVSHLPLELWHDERHLAATRRRRRRRGRRARARSARTSRGSRSRRRHRDARAIRPQKESCEGFGLSSGRSQQALTMRAGRCSGRAPDAEHRPGAWRQREEALEKSRQRIAALPAVDEDLGVRVLC
jgi:hypothetical protein